MSLEGIYAFHEGLDKALECLGKPNVVLKECQFKAVKAVVVDQKDTLCVLPTGKENLLFISSFPRSSPDT